MTSVERGNDWDNVIDNIMKNIIVINTNTDLLENSFKRLNTINYNKELSHKVKRVQFRTNQTVLGICDDIEHLQQVVDKNDEQNLSRLNKISENFIEATTKYINTQKKAVEDMERIIEEPNSNDTNEIDGISFEQDYLLGKESAIELKKNILDTNVLFSNVPRVKKNDPEITNKVSNNNSSKSDYYCKQEGSYRTEVLHLLQLQVEVRYTRKLLIMCVCAIVIVLVLILSLFIALLK